MATSVTLYHPVFENVTRRVDPARVDAWVASGWLLQEPDPDYADHADVFAVQTENGVTLRAILDDGTEITVPPIADDEGVAAFLNDPTSATRTTVATVIESSNKLGGSDVSPSALSYGRRWLILGDSHTDGAGSTNVTFAYASVSGRISGTELVSPLRQGFAGERSGQIAARLEGILDANPTIDAAFIMCGTNDSGQGVTPDAFIANMESMRVTLAKRRVPLVVGYVPPRATTDTTILRLITAYNLRLHRWAADHAIPVADTHAAVIDPLTGAMASAYNSGDNVHFNNAGHLALAKAVAPVLTANAKKAPWPVKSFGLGLLENPLNDAGIGGWDAISGTPSASYADPVPGDGLTSGKWYTMAFDNTAGGSQANMIRSQDVNQAGINVGDQLVAFFKLKSSGGASVAARWISGTTPVSIIVDGFYVDVPYSGYISNPYTVTEADKTRFRLGFSVGVPAGTSGSGSMGQLEVYNLTTGGLVGLY